MPCGKDGGCIGRRGASHGKENIVHCQHGTERGIDRLLREGGPHLPEQVQIKGGGGLNVVRVGGAHKLVCHIGIAHARALLFEAGDSFLCKIKSLSYFLPGEALCCRPLHFLG